MEKWEFGIFVDSVDPEYPSFFVVMDEMTQEYAQTLAVLWFLHPSVHRVQLYSSGYPENEIGCNMIEMVKGA